MREPLLAPQDYAVHWDPASDTLELLGTVSGPAGSAPVRIGTVTVDVDTADPLTVTSIVVEEASALTDPDAPARRILIRLIGRDHTARVLAAPHDHPTRVLTDDEPTRRLQGSGFGSLALALAGSAGPGLLAEERCAAVLQAAALALRQGLLDLVPGLADDARAAAAHLRTVDGSRLSVLEPVELMHRQWSELAEEIPDIAEDLSVVIGRIERLRPTGSVPDRMRPLHTAPPGSVELPVAPDAVPLLLGQPELVIERRSGDEYAVVLDAWGERAAGWWARAFTRTGPVPLALAPVRTHGGRTEARLLIPGAHLDDVVIDVVDGADRPRLSEQVAVFRAAIAAGSRASRLQRRGGRLAARDEWRRSAELHQAAGDARRAHLAENYAEGVVAGARSRAFAKSGSVIATTLVSDVLGPA